MVDLCCEGLWPAGKKPFTAPPVDRRCEDMMLLIRDVALVRLYLVVVHQPGCLCGVCPAGR
jgi:hypothetical protein